MLISFLLSFVKESSQSLLKKPTIPSLFSTISVRHVCLPPILGLSSRSLLGPFEPVVTKLDQNSSPQFFLRMFCNQFCFTFKICFCNSSGTVQFNVAVNRDFQWKKLTYYGPFNGCLDGEFQHSFDEFFSANARFSTRSSRCSSQNMQDERSVWMVYSSIISLCGFLHFNM